MIAVLDTHAIVWSLEDDSRLGESARNLIDNAAVGSIGISDISLLEISMLVSKGRITLNTSLQSYLNSIERFLKALPINAQIAISSMDLSLEQSDPFDRIITATAKYYKVPLITRDRLIVDSGLIETIWK